MEDWTLTDLPESQAGTRGIAGYGIEDALGVRIGRVSGWVTDPDDDIALLKVTIRDWFKSRDFLVPVGCFSQVDDAAQLLRLDQLPKRTLMKQCLSYLEELPPGERLSELVGFFPNPRPTVAERLAATHEVPPSPPPGRLTIRSDQGDGAHAADDAPTVRPSPPWQKLGRLAPPAWRSINRFADDGLDL